MEIIKHTLTTRNDFMSLLSTAPPPFPSEIEAKLKGLKLGTPSTVIGIASSSTQVSTVPGATVSALQQLVSTQVPMATVAPPSPTPMPLAVKPPAPISSSLPAPINSSLPLQRKSSGTAWKWFLTIGTLTAVIYFFRRYHKMKEEEYK